MSFPFCLEKPSFHNNITYENSFIVMIFFIYGVDEAY